MILKYPISIPDFLSTCKEMEHKPCFELVLSDLLYEHGVLQPEPFGLQGIRKVIEVYEQSLSLGESSSKKEMPFFREHQLRLIGPELVPFACSLFISGLCAKSISIICFPTLNNGFKETTGS